MAKYGDVCERCGNLHRYGATCGEYVVRVPGRGVVTTWDGQPITSLEMAEAIVARANEMGESLTVSDIWTADSQKASE